METKPCFKYFLIDFLQISLLVLLNKKPLTIKEEPTRCRWNNDFKKIKLIQFDFILLLFSCSFVLILNEQFIFRLLFAFIYFYHLGICVFLFHDSFIHVHLYNDYDTFMGIKENSRFYF